MISVNRINYAGYSSQDFDLITCLSFDSDSGDVETYLNREAVASESYRGDFKRVHSYKYQDVLAPQLTFIKDGFGDFSLEESRKVLKWLTSRDTASFLTVYHDDSEVVSYEILGGFIEANLYKAGNGRIIGITATFESVSPFAFSPLQKITKDVSNPQDNKITINLETDDVVPVYPRITIQEKGTVITVDHAMDNTDNWVEYSVFKYGNNFYWVDSSGDKHTSTTNSSGFNTTSVSIKNTHTDEVGKVTVFDTLVKKNVEGEKVVLDGANRVVSSSYASRIFGDSFSWNWLPMYEGKNELSFVGNCIVTVEFRYPIKCGEY